MKNTFSSRWILAAILTLALSQSPAFPIGQLDQAGLQFKRTRDLATNLVTYSIRATIQGQDIRRVLLVTPSAETTFTMFDTPGVMDATSLDMTFEADAMTPSFFTSRFPSGQYQFQVTFANWTTTSTVRAMDHLWANFPTMRYPLQGAADVTSGPLVRWFKPANVHGYSISCQAQNLTADFLRGKIAASKTELQLPSASLLTGSAYAMDVSSWRDHNESATRVTFSTAGTPPSNLLMPRYADIYVVGVTKPVAGSGYELRTEIQPETDGYSRADVFLPDASSTYTLFASPLAANPFRFMAGFSIESIGYTTGTYTLRLQKDGGVLTTETLVNVPDEFPAPPTILYPTEWALAGVLQTTRWQTESGAPQNAFLYEFKLPDWEMSDLLDPSVTALPILPYAPTWGPTEPATLSVVSMIAHIEEKSVAFTARSARVEFGLAYPSRAGERTWTLY